VGGRLALGGAEGIADHVWTCVESLRRWSSIRDVKAEPGPVPSSITELIDRRSGNATVRELAAAFAEQALRRDVELVAHASQAPRYFRVVWHGTTVAYVQPRPDEVRADYRLPYNHWAYGWGFGQDKGWREIGLKIDGQTAFQVGMRLLDDAIRRAADSN
jgi:hypothetical protein